MQKASKAYKKTKNERFDEFQFNIVNVIKEKSDTDH